MAKLRTLYADFQAELPEAPYAEVDLEQELREVEQMVRDDVVLVAEAEDGIVGFALAKQLKPKHARLTDLYVVPEARRRGVAAVLVREVVEAFRDRAQFLSLEVMTENAAARAAYSRWGFREYELTLVAPLDALEQRLHAADDAPSSGSVHVQTDDVAAVERAVRQTIPRLGRSAGSVVLPPRNGWIAVHDELCERDPKLLRRLARELSDRMAVVALAIGVEQGAVTRFVLFDRGRVMDEYLSVQEYYGPLPPGDVIALAANPTVVARLTGADPRAVREAAKHARRPEELPPPNELVADLARVLGIEGADAAWTDAAGAPGAIPITR